MDSEIDNNRVVHITNEQKHKASLWFETHYTFDNPSVSSKYIAPGLFIGVKPFGEGNQNFFDGFALGGLISLKRTPIGDKQTNSVNIGIGKVWHRTKNFASGIKDGEQLSSSYANIKYINSDETSWMLMMSFGF